MTFPGTWGSDLNPPRPDFLRRSGGISRTWGGAWGGDSAISSEKRPPSQNGDRFSINYSAPPPFPIYRSSGAVRLTGFRTTSGISTYWIRKVQLCDSPFKS